jgi:hypothetical protein
MSSLLPPAPLFPLPLFSFLCAVVLPAFVVSSFVVFVFSASPLLPFVALPMSFAPCRLRLCPAPLSPFGPSCSEPAQDQTRSSLAPRSPFVALSHLPPAQPPPSRELPLARPSLMSPPPALPPTTTRCCFPLCRWTWNPLRLVVLDCKGRRRQDTRVAKGGVEGVTRGWGGAGRG